MFVDDLGFNVDVFSHDGTGQEDTVFYNSSFFYDAAAPDHGMLYEPFNETAVRNKRMPDVGCVEVVGRTGVVGFGIDGPVFIKQAVSHL